ncbi:trehalose 6-phosphate phosphatase [Nocardioides flavus (ex Wang et al. 2016)]|uniref:Trehalose 6-phosphate phosphatase n=1 Tax=Nocardioides flavus (ex Wang et al. 2016) TaxID=2058780 RepID=A0ABQ3HKN3_9ACTN|nr:trehalose-phosphatase [Nocardioides flavus (ex Wang et al. 2016)]GHE16395.1 trehalose 6-phosphate phosphatase [Nocardioides flavus (ex Wang et al. 2016)]
MEFTSDDARAHYDAVRDVLDGVVVGLDFDGTLSPVVDDPEAARLHPGAPGALLELAEAVRAVAVITGRPARQAIAMGDLDALGDAMLDRGAELFVFGQYGNERWSATEQRIRSPRPPAGLASFERELPQVLRSAGAAEAYVEEKGLAVAVHTRRMDDPAGAFERLVKPIAALAERHRLTIEPGRNVIEVRSGDMHKGQALRAFVAEQEAVGVVFGGDDLGDVEAFEAVRALRADGLPGLVVCSASQEQPDLVRLADVVVDGPPGVVELLGDLARRR